MKSQLTLFGAPPAPAALPEGFRYHREVISPAEEKKLLEQIRELPFREFEFHGFTGKRRVVSLSSASRSSHRARSGCEERPERNGSECH